MTPLEAKAILEEFAHNEDQQKFIIDALDLIAQISAAVAERSGFHDDERLVKNALLTGLESGTHIGTGTTTDTSIRELYDWHKVQLLQAEIARMGEELGEAIDNIRHEASPDDKLPAYPGWQVELGADLIIRAMDTLGKRNIEPGRIFVEKTLFNINRPWKHGKNL